MAKPQVAQYGSWKSPITSDLIASGTIRIEQIALDGENIYWIEMRPAEGGRCVVVRRSLEGQVTDITPSPFNARTRAHEYGDGAYVIHDGTVYFSISLISSFIAGIPGAGHALLPLKERCAMQMGL